MRNTPDIPMPARPVVTLFHDGISFDGKNQLQLTDGAKEVIYQRYLELQAMLPKEIIETPHGAELSDGTISAVEDVLIHEHASEKAL